MGRGVFFWGGGDCLSITMLNVVFSDINVTESHFIDYWVVIYLFRTIGDELGEAKASGNLGNTLKLLGRYNEAVVCCQRHLDITRATCDKVGTNNLEDL